MYETNVNLSTVLIITLASAASFIAIAIGVGALHNRWALAGGVLVMATHSLVVRDCIICYQSRREVRAYELGRESVQALRG